jgi:hypothetical protein
MYNEYGVLKDGFRQIDDLLYARSAPDGMDQRKLPFGIKAQRLRAASYTASSGMPLTQRSPVRM